MQYVAAFDATQYNSSLSSVVLNFRILSQVVAEKSLEEKYLQTDRQSNIVTEKGKNIYPLYTSYQGGINIVIVHSMQVYTAVF